MIENGGVIDLNGYALITGGVIYSGYSGGDGYVDIGVGGALGTTNAVQLFNSTTFTITQDAGAVTGLELNNTGSGQLYFQSANEMMSLVFDDASGATAGITDWLFRWQGDHEATLEGYIGSQITVSGIGLSAADLVTYDSASGYTYIGHAVVAIPEPASGLLVLLGGLVLMRRRR